jgi:hypothetical protein
MQKTCFESPVGHSTGDSKELLTEQLLSNIEPSRLTAREVINFLSKTACQTRGWMASYYIEQASAVCVRIAALVLPSDSADKEMT